MSSLLTAWRRSNPPKPGDWAWVESFLDEPETQRRLNGGAVSGLDPEEAARTFCIKALKEFCEAYRAGDNELAWLYLEHAKEAYQSLPVVRKDLKLLQWEFWRRWLLMKGGARKRRVLQHPVFKDIARVGGMDADQVLAGLMAMEQSRRGSSTPRQRKATLKQRGFRCVVAAAPNISASELIDMVEAGSGAAARIYDYEDDNLRLYLDSNNSLVIKDLDSCEKTSPIPTQPTDQIRTCLKRARDRDS